MSVTPNKSLPLMEPSQSQPETVYNAAMEILDVTEALEVEQSGDSPGVLAVTKLKFVGATVAGSAGVATVTIDATSGGGGGSPLTVDTETNVTKITFTGPAVSVAPGATGEAIVTIDTVSGGSGGGGAALSVDSYPTSPDATDDEMDGTIGTLNAKWTWYHQNSATAVYNGQGALKFVGTINSAEDVGMIGQPLPGGAAWRFRSKISVLNTADFNNFGMYLHETGSGKILQYGMVHYSGAGQIWVETAGGFTSGGSVPLQSTQTPLWPLGVGGPSLPLYFEMELASGTLHFRHSITGLDGSFVEFYSVAQTTPFTTTPNVIGLGGYSFNASVALIGYCNWFRRKA